LIRQFAAGSGKKPSDFPPISSRGDQRFPIEGWKDEPEGTEKARIVMAPLWVDLWKESSRSRKVFGFVFG
jgi:hypothetical protein